MRQIAALVTLIAMVMGTMTAVVWGDERERGVEVERRPVEARQPEEVAVDYCPGVNLVRNPSFEGAFSWFVPELHGFPNGHPDCTVGNEQYPTGICTSVLTAPEWLPWWRSPTQTTPDQPFERNPEFKGATVTDTGPNGMGDRVLSGQSAQQYFSFYGTHRAGVYQQIPATPGTTYRFCAWGYAWSDNSNDGDFASSPTNPGDDVMRVGIDPTGGSDWPVYDAAPDPQNGIAEVTNSNVVWGDAHYGHDFWNGTNYTTWQLYVVEAVAQANTITLFTYSDNLWAWKNSDVYWDDAIAVSISMEMSVAPSSDMTFLAAAGQPVVQSRTATVGFDGPAGMTWNATAAGGTLPVNITPASGIGGESFTVTVDSSGQLVGSHNTTVTVTASEPATVGSPVQIPVTLVVAEQLHQVAIPMLARP